MTQTSERLKMMIAAALFAAITAVMAQLTIPIPIVPITGQTLAVGLTATILGSRFGALAMVIYATLGAIGIPVFSGASGGFSVIVGPTGGYIIGFIFTAFITGFILEKTKFNYLWGVIANLVGMAITLGFGVVQLKFVASYSWAEALAVGVTPFLVVGVMKAVLATVIGIYVRKSLVNAKLLSSPQQSVQLD